MRVNFVYIMRTTADCAAHDEKIYLVFLAHGCTCCQDKRPLADKCSLRTGALYLESVLFVTVRAGTAYRKNRKI